MTTKFTKVQKIVNQWAPQLRNMDIGDSFTCTTNEKLSIGPIATRLKKKEKLFFSINKEGDGYKVTRIDDPNQ